jgi:hypothetical protein
MLVRIRIRFAKLCLTGLGSYNKARCWICPFYGDVKEPRTSDFRAAECTQGSASPLPQNGLHARPCLPALRITGFTHLHLFRPHQGHGCHSSSTVHPSSV